MADLNDRLKAFESKYAMDEGMQFKLTARRNKLVGLWIGQQLGKSGDELNDYASAVVVSDMKEAGDEDVIAKIMADVEAAQLSVTRADVEAKLTEKLTEAKDQLSAED